jgi:hypothetical protein
MQCRCNIGGGKRAARPDAKMRANSAEMDPRSSKKAWRKLAAATKLRLVTIDHLDRRTRAGRRASELVRAFETELGGTERLRPGQYEAVRRAAALSAIADDFQARRLAGQPVDVTELVKVCNLARRAVLDLGIKPTGQAAPHVPLRERLAARGAR